MLDSFCAMTSPLSNFSTPLTFANSSGQSPVVPQTPTSVGRGRPRGSGTGAKRGRKPKNLLGSNSPRVGSPAPGSSTASPVFSASSPQFQQVHWAASAGDEAEGSILQGGISRRAPSQVAGGEQSDAPATPAVGVDSHALAPGTVGSMPPPSIGVRPTGMEEDADADDELLPAMADDDYSAQQSWNTQSKDNLKCVFSFHHPYTAISLVRILMDNFTPEQYERFEAYRRHALPKQAVRKVMVEHSLIYRVV